MLQYIKSLPDQFWDIMHKLFHNGGPYHLET